LQREEKLNITNLQFFLYFLKIGSTVFGGPLAVIDTIRYELIIKKKWITKTEFENFFGYSQIAPGPLAFQVIVYFAYFKKGFWAAVLSGIGLVIPSFLLVLIFSFFYFQYRDISYIQSALYGVAPVLVGVIFHSGFRLTISVLKRDVFLYLLFAASIALTVFFAINILYLIIGSALISLFYHLIKDGKIKSINSLAFPLLVSIGVYLIKTFEIGKEIISNRLSEIALLFLKVGSLTYGSGFVIVGVLRQEVVNNLQWLTSKEFIDGIAFGQITPGPVVITSTFIGYIALGIAGAVVATVCIFLPTFIFDIIIAGKIQKFKDNFYLKSLIKGANAASIGAIIATAIIISKDAVSDYYTIALLIGGLAVLFFTKFKSIYIILLAAATGIALRMII
jgi:chromate transporter